MRTSVRSVHGAPRCCGVPIRSTQSPRYSTEAEAQSQSTESDSHHVWTIPKPSHYSRARRNRPLPLPPVLDPVAITAKTKYRQPKPRLHPSEWTPFQERLNMNPWGMLFTFLLSHHILYESLTSSASQHPRHTCPLLRQHAGPLTGVFPRNPPSGSASRDWRSVASSTRPARTGGASSWPSRSRSCPAVALGPKKSGRSTRSNDTLCITQISGSQGRQAGLARGHG